jgi:hypothetical protein
VHRVVRSLGAAALLPPPTLSERRHRCFARRKFRRKGCERILNPKNNLSVSAPARSRSLEIGFERTRHCARQMGIGTPYDGQLGLRQREPWLALSVHTRLARCHHKSSCASTTPRTVSKPQRKPKTPWRARCFSGMRWSGCGMGLQHPSNRSSVLFVDARQHRDRAWCIEDEPSLNSRQPYELDACRPRQKIVEVMKGQTTTHVGIDIGARSSPPQSPMRPLMSLSWRVDSQRPLSLGHQT